MIKILAPETYSLHENPFQSLVVDIVARCNMECGYCYNPGRDERDMSAEEFERICASLPAPVMIKLSGGEPTLNPELESFIRIAHRSGHMLYIISNGLGYSDPKILGALLRARDAGARFSLGISMDGGYANAKAYKVINGRDCLNEKIASLKSIIDSGLTRICLSAIVVRGLNEDVIPQLVELAYENSKAVRYIHIRNAGEIGRWNDTYPYSLEELKSITSCLFTEDEFRQRCVGELHCSPESGRECCYRFRPTSRLQVSLLEFYTDRACSCPKRGRIRLGSDKIEPLFQSM